MASTSSRAKRTVASLQRPDHPIRERRYIEDDCALVDIALTIKRQVQVVLGEHSRVASALHFHAQSGARSRRLVIASQARSFNFHLLDKVYWPPDTYPKS